MPVPGSRRWLSLSKPTPAKANACAKDMSALAEPVEANACAKDMSALVEPVEANACRPR